MTLAEDLRIRPLENFEPLEISCWCRDYSRYNKYPASLLERFAIGIYQIHQGLEWKDSLNKAESYMSACLHFNMVAEKLDLNVFMNLSLGHSSLNFERLIYLISKIQQQIFYCHKSTVKSVDGKPYLRASRYKANLTEKLLNELISLLVLATPTEYRKEGLFHASKIMSGVL